MKDSFDSHSIKDAIVLLLAGGAGSRLNILVQSRAKPAVPFAGLYRIIDFTLSNVMNSGLTHVGVMTQYKPLSLMRHIGSGEAWDFTGRSRDVKILPPRTGFKDSDWYRGTADAVRQNIDFLKSHPSREVMILAGDHIFHMDFDVMIHFHRHKKADLTIAMMVVPKSQIHQFGAGRTAGDGRIVEWEEKPKEARTNLASMGIYVFKTDYLLKLLADNRDDLDFGMHMIPKAVANDNVFAYPFYGYWRDVGTIQSYWEANMDVIRAGSGISPEEWGIRPNLETDGITHDRCPARFVSGCRVSGSMISAGCVIEGEVVNSLLSPGVAVEAGALVRDSIIFDDCIIGRGATVDLAIMDKLVTVGRGAMVGSGGNRNIPNRQDPTHLYTGISLVGKGAEVPEDTVIGRNCIINPGRKAVDFPGPKIETGETV